MKIIVTGSSSFIGGALRRLCREKKIGWAGIDTAPAAGDGDIVADICDPALAERFPRNADAVVHLAAISRDADCKRDPRRAVEVNIQGTLNVRDAARRAGIPQLIFASSEWVYGDAGASAVDESSPIDANRLGGEYAITKLAGERLLACGAAGAGAANPAITVLRFGIVYGPRKANWSAVESLYHAASAQDVVTVGSRATARRFIHVDDIARGIVAAVGRREPFEVFNLTGPELLSLETVVRTSTEVLRRAVRIAETDSNSPSVRNADNRRARHALGWEPRIPLRDGLKTLEESSKELTHV